MPQKSTSDDRLEIENVEVEAREVQGRGAGSSFDVCIRCVVHRFKEGSEINFGRSSGSKFLLDISDSRRIASKRESAERNSTENISMASLRYIWAFLLLEAVCVLADFRVSWQDMTVLVNQQEFFSLYLTEPLSQNVSVSIEAQHSDLVSVEPSNFSIIANEMKWNIAVKGLSAGHSTLNINVTPSDVTDFSQAFVRVTIEKSDSLYHISTVVGWIYFLAWSVSFYPQIYSNYKRKSVVGLNFDYLSLNLVGFIMYALFNCGLFWIPEIEMEYFSRYPKGLNPVQVNDIFFSLHAVCATVITITQCFIYESGTQRVSTTARVIHAIFASFVIISMILSTAKILPWLDFLYYCSYVKLSITLIKYVPQAFYNYKRKSTVGWSIGNIFLDFTGGILSMLQMILNAYNYDDWESIFGDPTKFGLGFFSVAFDIFFIIQHYVLYRNRKEYVEIPGNSYEESCKVISLDRMNVTSILRSTSPALVFCRNLNCWTAGITKKHRKTYERTYPTVLVLPDDEQRRLLYIKRKPIQKIVLQEEIEDDFDETKYFSPNVPKKK
ncbi:hypothetical protein KM043_013264 [Ampulex compressa]|nr:hypothetical protein KM043_013264 [Ampulex compressa]